MAYSTTMAIIMETCRIRQVPITIEQAAKMAAVADSQCTEYKAYGALIAQLENFEERQLVRAGYLDT